MTETTKVMYIVVVDGVDTAAVTVEEDGTGNWKDSFRYTRPVLQSTLQLMGCKARHAFKVILDFTLSNQKKKKKTSLSSLRTFILVVY